jgi:hypothetical protein
MQIRGTLIAGRECRGEPVSRQLGSLLDVWAAAKELQVGKTVDHSPVLLDLIFWDAGFS